MLPSSNRFVFSTLLLLSGALAGRGQAAAPPYQVVIDSQASISGTNFRIEAWREATFVRLRFSYRDSTRSKLLAANPAYAAARQAAEAAFESKQLPLAERGPAIRQALRKLLAVEEPYHVYRRDSLCLSIRRNRALVQLLDSVRAASAETLERKAANRSRIVLDGTLVEVRVLAAAHPEKDFTVQSPSLTSHPLLYRLLHETLLVYRAARPNTFLDKRLTSGY